MHELPLAAAVDHDGSTDVDALLAAAAARQQARGRHVRGLLMQSRGPADAACALPMVLVDIATGADYLVSQPMGSLSKACRADVQGFARASRVLHAAAAERPQLVIVNRFGSLEAEGGGFCAELLALMADRVPLLTAVAARHRDAWLRFTGGAPLLAPRADAVDGWIETALAG